MSVFTGGPYGRLAVMLNTLSSLNIEIIVIISIRDCLLINSGTVCSISFLLQGEPSHMKINCANTPWRNWILHKTYCNWCKHGVTSVRSCLYDELFVSLGA